MGKSSTETSSSTVPKYTIRVALIWLVPVVSALLGNVLFVPFLLAALLTPLELPKVRNQLFGAKARKQLPCLKAPALMRLAILWVLQIWWVVISHAETELDAEANSAGAGSTDGAASVVNDYSWSPKTLSVVLPCAGEAEYALKTVRAVHETTPAGALKEIIVVDDGSTPPLAESHLSEAVQREYGVRIIRHQSTVGLIGSKKDGGDAATGDIVVFFDCHVAPQKGWADSFLRLVGENYRRIVTPVITDLDVTTWRQRGGNKGQAKCYLTWDADFKWFESDDPYVPVLSGGLLGISKRWWNETGGYDEHMSGWGGENLDQSLRSWLCGGEIMMAKDAFVAHMWRVPNDPRTHAHYTVRPGAAQANRMRAAVAWYGEFSEKLSQFPAMHASELAPGGGPWYGNVDNILDVKRRLQCKSFAWFMKRFRHVYEDAGLIPSETFLIKSASGKCLTYTGQAGTSPDGHGHAELRPCNKDSDRQRWHGANRDTKKEGQHCCSGLRAWNTDQCLVGATGGGVRTGVCDVSGRSPPQLWDVKDGQLRQTNVNFMTSGTCLQVDDEGSIKGKSCPKDSSDTRSWSKDDIVEPIETRLYHEATSSDVEAQV